DTGVEKTQKCRAGFHKLCLAAETPGGTRQAPGTLTADVYWQLTAFLVRANGVDFDEQALGLEAATRAPEPERQAEATASVPPVPPSEMVSHDDDPGPAVWAVSITLFVGAVLALIWAIRRRRSVT
ncbi:MAG: hypothetical protein P8129_15135, partial [Anaerolineae bacterium]